MGEGRDDERSEKELIDTTTMPMFPLGHVLFPSLVLPLHVFEPRYRAMVAHCLDGRSERPAPTAAEEPGADAAEFGVVLIERGSEVGGDDVRTGVGTVARILEASRLDDGRFVLATVGTRRIRVVEWLTDDPFPQAEVADWTDPDSPTDLTDAYRQVVRGLRRVLAMVAELGEGSVPSTIEVSDDPVLGSYQLSALAPLGPLDQQRLLAATSTGQRLDDLGRLLDEEARFLEQRLAMG